MAYIMKNTSRTCQEKCFAARSMFFASQGKIHGMTTAVDCFLKNLEMLLATSQWSNRRLAEKSGVSDRLVGMYRNRESAPSLDKAEMIAKAFGYELWQMQMPDFRPDIKNDSLERLYHAFIETDDAGRRVMESTAEYVTSHKQPSANGKDGHKNMGNASGSS